VAARRSSARVAILGCGAVGRAFAREFADPERAFGRTPFAGDLRLWSRARASVRRALSVVAECHPRSMRRVRAVPGLAEAVHGADVVLVCVADAAVAGVLREAAQARGARSAVWLVISGSLELAALRPRLPRGAALGRLHPLAPVPADASSFLYEAFGIEGDPRARRAAHALVRAWNGRTLELRGGHAARYHAGAALLGGGLVALFALAEELMAPAVRSRRALGPALEQFVCSNAANAVLLGPRRALTGPLARGAEATVRAHLLALGSVRHARAAYRALGEVMLDLARRRGTLDAGADRRLRRLLRGSARR